MYVFDGRKESIATARELNDLGTVVPFRVPGPPDRPPYDSFAITSSETATRVLRSPDQFPRGIENYRGFERVRAGEPLHPLEATFAVQEMLLVLNGKEHEEMRNLLSGWFNPGNIKRTVEPLMRDTVREIVRELRQAPRDCCVDMKPYIQQLPMKVICALSGIEPSEKIAELVHDAFTAGAMEAMIEHIVEVIAATGAPEGTILGELEQHNLNVRVNAFTQLLTAGYETTFGGILNTFEALVAEPSLINAVLEVQGAERKEAWRKVTEESLRLHPPIPFAPCLYPKSDCTIDGVDVPMGTPLVIAIQSVNIREDMASEDPLAFNPWRRSQNMTFGTGPHFCLGAYLARAELKVSLSILESFPEMHRCERHSEPNDTHPLMSQYPQHSFMRLG